MSLQNFVSKMNSHKSSINIKLSFWATVKQHGSKGEQITRDFLRKYQIPYKEQKTFCDLYYKNKEFPLRFDFQIWYSNTEWFLLEIDGLQHFKASSFGSHLTEEQIQKNFEEGKERDNLKNEYCKNHNIMLERIIWDGNKNKLIKNLTIMIKKYKKDTYRKQ
jgi:hypothetical protein